MNKALFRVPKSWSSLPKSVRTALVCCFAAGFFAHLFAITNLIPNPDGISRVYDEQQMTISGRWFLHYATVWNGYLQAPAVIGFFTLLFLSLASGLTVSLLRLRSPLLCGLCGALMAVFPSVAYTFLYLFTASAYSFGLLLAVLSVWLAVRGRHGLLLAVPLLACAVGTYQAYLAVATALSLSWLLLYALEGTHSARTLLRAALRLMCFLILSLALYYGILRCFLWAKDLTLLDYKGVSSMETLLDPQALLPGIWQAYLSFVSYFFQPHGFASYTTPMSVGLHAVLFAAALWAVFRLVRRNRCLRLRGAFAVTVVFCILMPLAFNLTVLMGKAMPIMRYALVFVYVLAFALLDRAMQTDTGRVLRGLRRAAACAAVLLCIGSFQIDNLVYTASATAHRATESYATRLVERVESTPGYQNGMQVLIIGGFPATVYYNTVAGFDLISDYSAPTASVLPLNKHIYYYLNDWLNVRWEEPSEELLKATAESSVFQEMPLYPDDGSIVISEGRVIVKVAQTYTPKRDYEIQYENRR